MTAAPVAAERPYQLLPPLDDEQRKMLRDSIEANGVLEPVVFDEDGEILDGHHRVEIAEELGVEYPRRVIDHLDEVGKQQYALTVNLARRQLTSAARSAHIMRLRQLGMSIRQIAKQTGLPKSTVADSLAQVSGLGHLPTEVTGADGKKYAASRPAPTQTPEPAEPAPSTAPAGSGLELRALIVDALRAAGADGLSPLDLIGAMPPGIPTEAFSATVDELVMAGELSRRGALDRGVKVWATIWLREFAPTEDLPAARPVEGQSAGLPTAAGTAEESLGGAENVAEAAEQLPAPVAPRVADIEPVTPAVRADIRAVARNAADLLLIDLRVHVDEIVAGIEQGETGLITPEMVASVRALADVLEARMGGAA